MRVYATPKTQATDGDGNTQPIAAVGPYSDELKIADLEMRDWTQDVIKELKIMNLHLSSITDLFIDREEVEV